MTEPTTLTPAQTTPDVPLRSLAPHLGLWVQLDWEHGGWLIGVHLDDTTCHVRIRLADGTTHVGRYARKPLEEGWPAAADRRVHTYPWVCDVCGWPLARSVVDKTPVSQILGWIHAHGPAEDTQHDPQPRPAKREKDAS